MDTGRLVIDAPPDPPEPNRTNPLARLMPVAMIAAMAGMTVLYMTSTDTATRNPMFLFFPVMMVVSLIGTLAYGGRGAGRAGELTAQRAEYLRYLDTVDDLLARGAEEQHRRLHCTHPDPASLWTLAGSARMWERAEDDGAFGVIRIGIGAQPCAITAVAPDLGSGDRADPVSADAVRRMIGNRSVVLDVPVTIPLRAGTRVTVTGDPDTARSVVSAMVCQVSAWHHPDLVCVSAPPGRDWDWVKWLPHQRDSGSCRLAVVVADGATAPPGPGALITVAGGTGEVRVSLDGNPVEAGYDVMSPADALAFARRIAGRRRDGTSRPRGRRDWCALTGIDDPTSIDVRRRWAPRPESDRLRAPIGVAEDGSVVVLDIKESAAGGLGPHGLCVGATGSGKSEFLRTLVLGMITDHPPELLNLVLVDFKGGATFLGLEKARHVAAVITNLADEAPLVSRMRDALSGEINRRQETLRSAGNLANIGEYARARTRGDGLPPLPALFVIVDEFSELLSRHPDFADLFVAIGRLGRSLGIHLLLASQRLDEGRLRGLETHLSYRICLKTFSAAESRAVLGVPDAYALPSEPGAGYLKTASGALTRFQTAFVSGGYTPTAPAQQPAVEVRRFTRFDTGGDPTPQPQATASLIDTVLAQVAGCGMEAHRVWLPPLRRAPSLAELLAAAPARLLTVPIGVVDRPFEQRQTPHLVDLSAAAGNVAVVGAPRTGKSTTLLTMITALAATHDAGAVHFYCLDFGGGELARLKGLPHVGAVAGRRDADLARRTVAHVEAVLRQRESEAAVRDTQVFLVVDGWATVRQDFDGLEPAITALAVQGLAYGVHVVLAASRWADLRPALKDQIGTRIELRLGDPSESEMDRRRAREIADRPAGRGLTRDGSEMAIAVPDLRTVRTSEHTAPPVQLLPTHIDRRSIAAVARAREVLLGLGERDLAPVTLDLDEHPHLLILGENECGKTAALRLLCTELEAAQHDLRLEIVDVRRTLLGVVESARLTGYAVTGAAVTSRLAALTETLTARMPDERVTQRQLRDRSWWSGPELYVLVDDYDMVAGATGNPLNPLAEFLPHAKDIGLHLIVARRSGGAARAMFDPVLARMRDMGCAGLMMSATAEDGVLLGGVRPVRLPAGRGTLVVRGRPDELIQVGWVDPP
ncbi:type VII secretion protein EccC [Mycolicibacterium parafortuitum]|uniref:type VII secretion protein EccCa n=1 Tax=Mycolicibacterium parafortuitum TaxID=39692 RepID=UPI0032C43DA9